MDLPIPGKELTAEAVALNEKVRLGEARMRVDKLKLRKLTMQIELEKVDYEIGAQQKTLKELEEGKKEEKK